MKTPDIIVETLSREMVGSGYLQIDKRKLKFSYPDNTTAEMVVDSVYRKLVDAVVIVAYYVDDGIPYIYFRSSLRPSISVQDYSKTARTEELNHGNLWELPAGLVEENETSPEGLQEAARRETLEELGFDLPASSFESLGHRIFSSPGITSERLFFFVVRVNPKNKGEPTEDGSPLEHCGIVEPLGIKKALNYIELGQIADAKTEIGVRRFHRGWISYKLK